ncbi:MAG: glycine--tRNA ligase subunit beta [Deltaproteobacteria bacterium]|nr:glycine--tRNA ligase subunit beta [Deltaproteobacteria bacterium]
MSGASLFVEVRCEELPTGWGAPAAEALGRNVLGLLEGIPHGAIRTWHTPCRIAAAVDDVASTRPRTERIVLGPSAGTAFRDGRVTPAGEGFARARGVAPEALEVVDGPKGPVAAVRVEEGGEPVAGILAQGLESAILEIPFPRTMRWGAGPWRWARPIQGVCAVLGGAPIPATVAGLPVDARSNGHRQAHEPFGVVDAEGWEADLQRRFVIADASRRRAAIVRGLQGAAAEAGVEPSLPDALLDRVCDLVEWPVVVAGTLKASLLDLPPRLLVESMRVHLRIFDTRTPDGSLAPVFLAVSNAPRGDPGVICAGYARVLAARFEDARFFFDEDRKRRLEAHGERLERMQWVRGLGTMAEKALRVGRLAAHLGPDLGADPEVVARAGALCKADLATLMVGEFPDLQGHVGRLYARHQGEPESVAAAIEEHYLPRFADDVLPGTPAGRVLALADRLDTLAGCFAAGLAPRGGADPQGLRRAANGVVAILRDAGLLSPLGDLFDAALSPFASASRVPLSTVRGDLVAFVLARLRATLQSEDVPTELVDAVLAAGGDSVVRLAARAEALRSMASGADFGPLCTAFRRVAGLAKDHPDARYDPSMLQEPAERALHRALNAVRDEAFDRAGRLDYEGVLEGLATLKRPVDTLFDQVLVMAEDPAIRANRLGLLRSTSDLFDLVADFSRLSADAGP